MRIALTALVLAASTLTLPAQVKPADDVATLKAQVQELQDQVTERDLIIANLKMSVLQGQAAPVAQERNNALKTLEDRHPGMHWDDAQQRMVANPPAKPAIPAKPEAAKK